MKKKYKTIPLSKVLEDIGKADPERLARIKARSEELALSMKLREARMKKNLSQLELSERSGVSQDIISRFESGKQNVTLQTLSKISFALGKEIEIRLK